MEERWKIEWSTRRPRLLLCSDFFLTLARAMMNNQSDGRGFPQIYSLINNTVRSASHTNPGDLLPQKWLTGSHLHSHISRAGEVCDGDKIWRQGVRLSATERRCDLEARSNPESKAEINALARDDALLIDGIAQVERKRTNTFVQIRSDCWCTRGNI